MEKLLICLDGKVSDSMIGEEEAEKPKGSYDPALLVKKSLHLLFLLFLCIFGPICMSACGDRDSGSESGITCIMDLDRPEYIIGGMTGIVATKEAQSKLVHAKYQEYPMPADAFTALASGKITSVVLDRPTLEYMSRVHPELMVLQEDLATGKISVAADPKSEELMAKVNEFIANYREDGTYQAMFDRWFHTLDPEIPEIAQPEKLDGVLRVGITDGNVPMSFIKNGKPAGFDNEFALRLGAFVGKKVEFVDLPYDALISALNSNKIDLAIAQMDATPERGEEVLFSDYYIDSPITMLIHRSDYVSGKKVGKKKIAALSDLDFPDYIIGSQTDILAIREAKIHMPRARFLEYPTAPDSYLALTSGKIDAVSYDRPALEYAILSHPELMILPGNLAEGHISVGAKVGNEALMDKVNEYIAKMREDGTYEEMFNRWVCTKNPKMPEIATASNPDGTLVIGIDADNCPMNYIEDGKNAGYDIEFAMRMALYMNKKLEFKVFPYESQIPALTTGKIDLSIAQLDYTPERGEEVLFSDPYIDSPIAVMIRKKDFDSGKQNGKQKIAALSDLDSPDYIIGSQTDILAIREAKIHMPKARFLEYPTAPDSYLALTSGKIDAVSYDRPALEYAILSHPELMILPGNLAEGHISVGAKVGNEALMDKVNEYIAKMREDGIYEEMFNRWVCTKNPKMPEIAAAANPDGTLVVGIDADNCPMNYIEDGENAGYDIEFAKRLALYMNKKLEFKVFPYESQIPALTTGKIDLSIAQLDYTPERGEEVLFSDPYIDSPIAVMIRKKDFNSGKQGGKKKIAVLSDLDSPDYIIGSQTDILAIREAKIHMPKARILEYPTAPDSYLALTSGKIDAVSYDRPALEYAILSHPELMILPGNLADGHISVGAKVGNEALMDKVNEYIAKMREDGIYEEMFNRWVCTKNPKMPEIAAAANPDGTLVVGIDADNCPMNYIEDGENAGYDIEFAKRLALYMNKKLEFKVFPYESQIPALTTGKIDLSIAQLDYTPERGEEVLFSDPYIDSPIAVMIRKKDFNSGRVSADGKNKIVTLSDLDSPEYIIASQTDILAIREAKARLTKARYLEFATAPDSYLALASGKVNAVVYDRPALEYAILSHPELMILPEDLSEGHICIGAAVGSEALMVKVNEFIDKIRADGTYQNMFDRWVKSKNPKMPDIPAADKPEGTLVIGVDADNCPMNYIEEGQHVGYDIEFAKRLALFMNKKLEFKVFPYESQIPALTTGKIDLSIAQLDYMPERGEEVLFSKSYIDSPIAMMIRKKDFGGEGSEAFEDEEESGFKQWIKESSAELSNSFEKTFLREGRWKMVFRGLWTTFYITVFAVILGTIIAFPICAMCRSHNHFSAWLGARYVSIIQGTPILVILMIMYYIVFAKVDISAPFVAILAFAIDFSAYTSVSLRAGIDSIPRGQMEAALALGFKPTAAFFRFILPQAVRINLPVYRGEVISTLKATSIVGYISIYDLTKMGDIIRSRTYEAFFPLIAIAILYFILAKLVTASLLVLEKRLNPEYHRNEIVRKLVK